MDQQVLIKKDGQEITATLSKTFISNVFTYMFAALAITGVVSYSFGSNMDLISILRNPETGGMTMMGWVVLLAPLGFVILMNRGFNRYSSMILLLMFVGFSI